MREEKTAEEWVKLYTEKMFHKMMTISAESSLQGNKVPNASESVAKTEESGYNFREKETKQAMKQRKRTKR